MPSIDDLMREIAQLRTENDMLKMLLKENGIDLPIVAADPTLQDESPTDAAVTKRSPLPEKNHALPLPVSGTTRCICPPLGEQKRTLRLRSGVQKRMEARLVPEAERKMRGLLPCGILRL